jgi:hypothetical protein
MGANFSSAIDQRDKGRSTGASVTDPQLSLVVGCLWKLHLRTMTGRMIAVECSLGGETTVAQVKCIVAEQIPQWPVDRQILLLPPPQSNDRKSSGGNVLECANVHDAPEPLADSQTLGSYGLADGASLELLVQDIEWRVLDCELHELIAAGGVAVDLSDRKLDARAAAAIAWAISNEVRIKIGRERLLMHDTRLYCNFIFQYVSCTPFIT